MIERFQEEHPGFDFRSAEFNGQVPDLRAFMGGVKYAPSTHSYTCLGRGAARRR